MTKFPTLTSFIFRSQALSLYRKFLRETRVLQGTQRAEIRSEIRREFEAHRSAKEHAIKFHLTDGKQRLKQLTDMLGLQR